MKIVSVETLINSGSFPASDEWHTLRSQLHDDIRRMDWPPGTGTFTVYPESGKKSGQGNGVKPIKDGLMYRLERRGWQLEKAMDIATVIRPGKLDAVFDCEAGPVAVEWETGNISSSHRALNKMCLGLMKGLLVGGVLVVPSRDFYKFLTDRVGNISELRPYLDLWSSIKCDNGILEIIVVEYDDTSFDVPRIKKGTDGRALI